MSCMYIENQKQSIEGRASEKNYIEEYQRISKYESCKHRPIRVVFQSWNIMKNTMRNAKKLKDNEIKNMNKDMVKNFF